MRKTCFSLLMLIFITASAYSAAAAMDETPLAKHMESINDNLRTLRGQVGDASKQADNLAIVKAVREDLESAKELIPQRAAEHAGPAREGFLKGYRAKIDEALSTVGDLEKAIAAGQGDEAMSILVKLNDVKKEGHSQYKKQE